MSELQAVALHAKNVRSALNSILLPRGFKHSAVEGEKYHMEYWRLDHGWKVDVVKFAFRSAGAMQFNLSLSVRLPDPTLDMEERRFTGVDLGDFAGRSSGYKIPRFFGRITTRSSDKFTKKIADDLKASISWFDKFKTPSICLQEVETMRKRLKKEADEITILSRDEVDDFLAWFEDYFSDLLDLS